MEAAELSSAGGSRIYKQRDAFLGLPLKAVI